MVAAALVLVATDRRMARAASSRARPARSRSSPRSRRSGHDGRPRAGPRPPDAPAGTESLRERLRSIPVFAGDLPDPDPATVPDDPATLFIAWLDDAIAAGSASRTR